MTRIIGTLNDDLIVDVACDIDEDAEAILIQPSTTGQTTVAAGSDGASLPQSTINVASTIAIPFASSGEFFVVANQPGGVQTLETITYTGKSNTTFTGCSGGTGVLSTGNEVFASKRGFWTGVDRWLTGSAPDLTKVASGFNRFKFYNIGGLIYGLHTNEAGLPGAPGAQGAVGIVNAGEWSSATSYLTNDVVTYLGNTFIALQNHSNQTPSAAASTAYWDRVAIATGTPPVNPPPDPPPVVPPPNAGSPTVSLDQPGIAGKLIFWGGLYRAGSTEWSQMTDAQLQKAIDVKCGGLALNANYLYGMGGSENWTGNASDPLSGNSHIMQKQVRDSNFVNRARALGLTKLYIGNYSRFFGQVPMWGDWFNDSLWNNTVLPAVTNFAAAAKLMGFDGINIDNEGGSGWGDWFWNYQGNTHNEADTRAKVKQRGAQLMTAYLSGFPNCEFAFYNMNMSYGLKALRGLVISPANYPGPGQSVQEDWLNGFTSVAGYSRIRIYDDAYYTDVQLSGAVFETTLQITTNSILAYLSRTLDNWAYANQRFSVTPFLWLGPTTSTFESHLSASTILSRDIPNACRKLSMSGEIANYMYQPSNTPGQTSYAAFQTVYDSFVPGVTDTTDPTLSGITVTRRGSTGIVDVAGTADDNFGIRAVRWVSGANSGACRHTFVAEDTRVLNTVTVPDYQKAAGTLGWHATFTTVATAGVPAAPGAIIVLVVEDIKGRAVSYSVVAP